MCTSITGTILTLPPLIVCITEGEVVLQSNEIKDSQEYAPTIAYIQHCLDWFDYDDDVCEMYCDEDNNYDFYDITGHYIDGDGDLVLEVRCR